MEERNAELKDRLQKALDIRKKKPVDLSKDLDIPKSAISQYLSGGRNIKDSRRLYAICKYLDVSEAWMMGFDVPMERPSEVKETDELVLLIKRLEKEKEFRSLVLKLGKLNSNQLQVIKAVMAEFSIE